MDLREVVGQERLWVKKERGRTKRREDVSARKGESLVNGRVERFLDVERL